MELQLTVSERNAREASARASSAGAEAKAAEAKATSASRDARARVADVEERLAAKSAALREALADSEKLESLTMEADSRQNAPRTRELMAERLAGRVAELEATETRLGDAASAAEQKRRGAGSGSRV